MLSNKKGQMTNGIYGFLITFQKLLSEISPQGVLVAFDLPDPTFRHKIYEGYKLARKGMPDELASQLPILKELLNAMGYSTVSCAGFEADDILGTFATYCEKNGFECVLATGDRDILQLVSEKTTVRITVTKFGKSESIFYDLNKVKEEYGTLPQNLVDIKALQGDISDNIPGVKGIGQKIAKELISKFGSIELIYSNIDKLEIKQSLKNKLIAGKESAYMSYALGKIEKNVPIQINSSKYIPAPMNKEAVRKIMSELEFFSLMEKMDLQSFEIESSVELKQIENMDEFLKKISSKKSLIFLADIQDLKLKSIFIEYLNKVYFVNSNHENFHYFVKSLMELETLEKVTYDLKMLQRSFSLLDIKIKGNQFDVMLAAYLLIPSEKDYSLSRLCKLYQLKAPKITKLEAELAEAEEKAKEVFIISQLTPLLKNQIENNHQRYLLNEIEQPLSEVLSSMESVGFLVDKEKLETYSHELESELSTVESCIYDLAGETFNLNSPKQLSYILFEKLGLPKGKKGRKGYSTDAQTLESLRNHHEVVDGILGYRMLSKLKSTYCEGMMKAIEPDGRIHSSFNQTETRTGRISSTEPNLQNIPIRTPRGKEFRKFFKAPEGCVLVDADYSQIELRVLAHVSQDENMIKAFRNHEDIHSITASEIFSIPLKEVTSEMRSRAKTINFGILYGMGAFSLSQDLKMSCQEAQNYIDKYLSHYYGINEYMNNVIQVAKTDGYVETMFLRRRYLPEINSSNYNLRAFGQRVARNMPIQGTAADIIKIAMINVFRKLKETKSKLILQVHDELIVESPKEDAEKIKDILKLEMENAAPLLVPLEVNVSVGKTWFDAKG